MRVPRPDASSGSLIAAVRLLTDSTTTSSRPLEAICVCILKNALPSRLNAACAPWLASSTAPPISRRTASPKRGRKSAEITWPSATLFENSAAVLPMAFAAISNAPGSASPSCPRSSSMLTTPLPAICSSALNTRFTCSVGRRRETAASVTPVKMSFVCWSVRPARSAEAEKPAKPLEADWMSMPSRSASAAT